MGNNILNIFSDNQLQTLNISHQQKQQLKIYLWRANSETNQYIPRVKINNSQQNSKDSISFDCFKNSASTLPSLQFQKYICDFRNLKKKLKIQELLFVFRYVLYGHQAIYKKLGSTLINQKCCFLTHQGQIRIWMNPNYYLNNFWQKIPNQIHFKSFSCHSSHGQTPRFMNKKQFDFENNISQIHSESKIINKIIKFMSNFSINSSISNLFWKQIEKHTTNNIMKLQSFQEVHKIIINFSNFHQIPVLTNINKIVNQLVNQQMILNQDSIITKRQKKSLSVSGVNNPSINSFNKQSLKQKELFIDTQFNGVSILDLKTNLQNIKKYDHNSNLSRLLATTTYHQASNSKDLQIFYQSTQKQQSQLLKNQLKDKVFGHKRKLSKSLVSPTAGQKLNQMDDKLKMVPSFRLENFKKPNSNMINFKNKSSLGLTKQNKLHFSYQYSINLYSQSQNLQKKCERSQLFTNPISSNLSSKVYDNSFTKQTSPYIEQELRISKHSKTASILKNGNNSRSFQIRQQQTQDNIQEEKENFSNKLRKRKSKHVVLPKKQNKNNINFIKNSFDSNNQNKKFLINSTQNNTITQKVTSRTKNSNLFYIFKDQQQVQTTKNGSKFQTSLPINQLKKKQTSCFNIQNSNYQQRQKQIERDKIYQQLYDIKKTQKLATTAQPGRQSNTSLYHKVFDQKKSSNNKQYVKPPLVLNSVLLNVPLDTQIQQEIIRSKRRISWGETDQLGIDINTLNNPSNQNIALKTFKTITRLVSSHNDFQSSIGSFSSNSFSNCDSNNSQYTGILTKMGRSAHLKKVDSKCMNNQNQLMKDKSILPIQQMPNFHKTKSIYQHGLNRSMKF